MNPLVSVVIPTRNRARLLERAVESVLRQTYRTFEIIIVDDASTDETAELLRTKLAHIPTLRYIRNEQIIERSQSRNRGITLAAGEFIACLDDDDEYLPDFLKTLAGYLQENPRYGLVFSDFLIVNDDGATVAGFKNVRRYRGFSCREWCLLGMVAPPCAALFRRAAFERVGGFREGFAPIEDREFFCRIAVAYPVHYIQKVTARHYIHAGSYSHIGDGARAQIKEKIWESIFDSSAAAGFHLRRQVSARIQLNLADAFLPDLGRSRVYLTNALRDEPLLYLSPAAWSLLVRITLPQRLYSWMKTARYKR